MLNVYIKLRSQWTDCITTALFKKEGKLQNNLSRPLKYEPQRGERELNCVNVTFKTQVKSYKKVMCIVENSMICDSFRQKQDVCDGLIV